jgi:mRNA-degrading endonuclease RelE of RelBE toxin-antitoxin system
MKYAIILSPEAIEDLRRLKAPIRSQVKEGIEIHLQGEKMEKMGENGVTSHYSIPLQNPRF